MVGLHGRAFDTSDVDRSGNQTRTHRVKGIGMWQIRMLGRFEVLSPDAVQASFRSRKAAALLALLALNKGREIANATLRDLLWPDSDGDRQAQCLRRAIADVRDAIEVGVERGAYMSTALSKTILSTSAFETDVERFLSLLEGGHPDQSENLRATEAIALYGGPLLLPIEADWVYPYRRQLEEVFCKTVESLCLSLAGSGQGVEAVRIANAAIVLAPQREEVFRASIRSYAAIDNQAMALKQYEALEKMLDDNFGQTPSIASLEAIEAQGMTRPDKFYTSSTGIETLRPESVDHLSAESRFYVERRADQVTNASLAAGEPVVLVFGPRQVGKTSLIARSSGRLRERGVKVVVTDFQTLGKTEIARAPAFYRTLIHSFATQLGLTYDPSWNEWVGPNSNLDQQIDNCLRQTDGRVCWAMDEVDRVFATDYADDFFGLVRSWHNRRLLEPEGPWKRMSILISYANEAHLFIKDINQSPFNVGTRVSLRDFTEDEVRELGAKYGAPVSHLSPYVFELTKGHPYLARKVFSFLHQGGSIDELRSNIAWEDGPFSDHLHRILAEATRDKDTEDEVRRLLQGEEFASKTTRLRLWSAGLVSLARDGRVEFRVPAYETLLRTTLL